MHTMRCDSCHALRWYGQPLEQFSCVFDDRTRVFFLCAVCAEERALALDQYLPTMHRPHHIMQ